MSADVKSWHENTTSKELFLYSCICLFRQKLNQGTNRTGMQTGHPTDLFHTVLLKREYSRKGSSPTNLLTALAEVFWTPIASNRSADLPECLALNGFVKKRNAPLFFALPF